MSRWMPPSALPPTDQPAPGEDDGPATGPTRLETMAVEDLVAACRAETAKRQRGESFSDAYGFELFRRAVAERDAAAWEGVLTQYRGLVTSWVLRHPAYAPGRFDAQDVVIRAFGRLWMAVGPERLSRFPGLGALLQYLKLCAHSVLLDEAAAYPARQDEATAVEDTVEQHDIEALALDRLSGRQLWNAIMALLHDEDERLIVHLSFAIGLPPGGICERQPSRFASVADVYRIKRNVIDRLRRSDEIRAFLRPERFSPEARSAGRKTADAGPGRAR